MFTTNDVSIWQVVLNFCKPYFLWWYQKIRQCTVFDYFFIVSVLSGLLLAVWGGWRVGSAGVVEYLPVAVVSSAKAEPGVEQVATSAAELQVTVEVAGAVERPGVYSLAVGSRVGQVLGAAGGVREDADGLYVAKEINLAQQVIDQQKIYVPFLFENVSAVTSVAQGSRGGDEEKMISVNEATLSELMSLEGIGEKRAADIIAGRPYQNSSELIDQKIITAAQWEKIKAQVSF